MKLRIEISDDADDEVVIRVKSMTDAVRRLESAFSAAIGNSTEMVLSLGETEYYVPVDSILFFETDSGRVTAHTADRMFYTDRKLYELEQLLPRTFARVSKSCIVNSAKISALSKGISGLSEAKFRASPKKVAVSRMYYKILKEIIAETRFTK